MGSNFICTNISHNNSKILYITSKKELEELEDMSINLRCFVDDFFIAINELEKVENKIVNYYIRIQENVKMENYKNLFDTFYQLKKYKNNIIGLEINLYSKVKNKDFEKLISFLQQITKKTVLIINIGNLEVFNNKQLEILKNSSININPTINLNQFYQGKYRENNNYDNIYSYDELINIKNKIKEIISKIPKDYNDIEKMLFLYKYLGKKIHYDNKIANLNYKKRQIHDSNSIYDVLFENKGVCSGIAVTFRVLMDAIGIKCQVVSSKDHEWNVVKVNGSWYHLDLTWDLDNIKHNNQLSYFLKSEKYIIKDSNHRICTYYAKENEKANRSIPIKIYRK